MKHRISISEVTDVLHDDEFYKEAVSDLKDFIRDDIHNIATVVHLYEDSRTIMSIGNMYTLLVLMKSYNRFKDMTIDKNDFLSDYSNVGSYNRFFDNLIDKFHSTYEDSHSHVTELMEEITYSINELAIFSSKNVILETGPTVSIKDILDIGKRNPEFKETIRFTHKESTSHLDNIKDVIKGQDENNRKSVGIIMDDGQSQFKRLLESGGGVNVDQLGEVINVIGYKPDMRGVVVPKPIDTSFFRGLYDVQDFFTDALGARKALNMSKLQVRQSGYLNRKISILTEDVRIGPMIKDCHTKQFMQFKISSKEMFELFIGRYHNIDGEDHIITEDDTYLIGSNINLRSPITCALEGEELCWTCYGKLSKVNMGLNVGTVANLIFTEPMTQKLLSTKHLLKVKVDVEWEDSFFEYFNIDGNIVTPKDPELEVFIDEEDFIINEGFNTNRFRTKKFFVMNEDGETPIYLDSPVNLLIMDSNIDEIDEYYDEEKDAYKFSLENIDSTSHLFTVVIRNTGVADPLLEMKDGLDRNYKMNEIHKQNLFSYYQDLMELLIESDTYVMAVHIEVILVSMIKFHDREVLKNEDTDILEWEDEENIKRKHYNIYNINDAIYHADSPVKALMYQQTVRQLTSDSFNNLFDKSTESEFDRLFIN